MSAVAVAGYEIRRILRDRALPALLILLLALSAYAAWNGADWVRQRNATLEQVRSDEQTGIEFIRKFVTTMPVVDRRYSPVLPVGAMAPLSIGQAEAYPFAAEVFALSDAQIFRRTTADIGSPTVRAAGRFDLAYVIVFLLPLVLLAACYDLWARERERGVAAMILSQSIAIGPLIAVKTLARGTIVLLPSTAIILGVAVWAGARDPLGLTAMGLAILAYGCFWLSVAVLISLFARRSTEAAVAAGTVWLGVVVMAPSLALAVVDLVAPPPSEMRFVTELKAQSTAIDERQRAYRSANPTPVRMPAPKIPDNLHNTYADRLSADLELAPMIHAHQQAKDARRHLLDTVRFLLPSVAVQDALDRIAGSDADRAHSFETQAQAFRIERLRWVKARMDRNAPLSTAEFDQLPAFKFHEASGTFQDGLLADLAVLIIATLFILIAAWAFRDKAPTP